jgi:carbon storage regulator CsrA
LSNQIKKGDSMTNTTVGGPRVASRRTQQRVSCEIENGIPMVCEPAASYYVFNRHGQRQLILTRKQHESIMIDNAINLVVLEINHNDVKIGVVCPDHMQVCCDNLHQK